MDFIIKFAIFNYYLSQDKGLKTTVVYYREFIAQIAQFNAKLKES